MNKRGETLLEVLIALTLVTVSAAAAASASISAVKGLSLSKNYLIAQNLASEALEVVKNIRDTNWMKFPINKETCWLNIQDIYLAGDCNPDDGSSFASSGSVDNESIYIVASDPITKKWTAISSSEQDITNEKYGLVVGEYGYNAPVASEVATFYRFIKVLPADLNSIKIQAVVKWYEGSKPYEVTGTEILTNYL